MNVEQAWDFLIDTGRVTEEALVLVTTINGHSLETLNKVAYVHFGVASVEKLKTETENG